MTHNTREVEENETTLQNLSFWNVLDTDEQCELRTTLHHQLQKAREASYFKGYNAGLADGTDKPLLSIEQMLQKAREEERERILKELRKVGITSPALSSLVLTPDQFERIVSDHSELDQDKN